MFKGYYEFPKFLTKNILLFGTDQLYHFNKGTTLMSFGQWFIFEKTIKVWQMYQPISRSELLLLKNWWLFWEWTTSIFCLVFKSYVIQLDFFFNLVTISWTSNQNFQSVYQLYIYIWILPCYICRKQSSYKIMINVFFCILPKNIYLQEM
jgi:hypothetical protein